MLTERNPYDPVELKWPSFVYWVKAGAAFTLGASFFGIFLLAIAWVLFLAGLGAALGPPHR